MTIKKISILITIQLKTSGSERSQLFPHFLQALAKIALGIGKLERCPERARNKRQMRKLKFLGSQCLFLTGWVVADRKQSTAKFLFVRAEDEYVNTVIVKNEG